MSLPRYPEYKTSGVEWLGEVPGHWGSAGLRWLSTRYSGGTPDKLNLDYWTDGTIPWLNSGEVNQSLVTEPSTYITEEAFHNSSAKWIPQGALVMALAGQGKTKGMVAQLGIPTTCNQSMAAIIPTQEQDARFLFWWLTSNYQNIRNMAGGDLRDGLNLELLGNIPCPLAPLTEQQTIAAFLDRETGKIDALIAEQQRLVELLAEKRQAVISHAVTKGLNPKAKMKDSGIEWLGEVPEHWEVKRLKFLCNVQTGDKDTVDAIEDGEYPFYVRSQTVERINGFTFDCEAVLTAGDGVGVGKVYHYVNGKFDFHQRVYMMNNFRFVSGKFFFQYLAATFHKVALGGGAKSTVDSLRMPLFMNFEITVPPIEEQSEIIAFLDTETAKFDTLTAEANRAIALLQERRSALISAAVTGKIDVRKAA